MEIVLIVTQACVLISLLALLLLHFVSREYQPSWRMISEYANGKHKWLITLFFLSWGFSSFFAAILAWSHASGFAAVLGLLLLILAGIGEVMGGLFDIKHKLHGLSFMMGVPALPIAAVLLSYNVESLENASTLKLVSHFTWLSVVLMGISMAHMFAQFKKAGLALGPEAKAPEQLPAGVNLFSGYANRLLVLVYHVWIYLLVTSLQ